MSDKARLSNAELELTQRIQMHFPRGVLSTETLRQWNGCSGEIIMALIAKAFGASLDLLPSKDKTERTIDCDVAPFVPDGWKVEEHKKGGQFVFDPAKVKLYLSPNQRGGKVIEGNKLRKELANEPVLNANVLDYLLAHPGLIPVDWKKDEQGNTRYIFFLGTIYRFSDGRLYVRCLYWNGDAWDWNNSWLSNDWDDHYPAALLAS